VKKSIALLIVALLVLPMLSMAPVRASTGHPQLGAWDGATLSLATLNVTIKAGDSWVQKIDGTASDWGDFAICFNTTDHLVDFSGAVFDVYISKDGYSALSASDLKYAGSFNVADLGIAGLKQVNITNALLLDGEASFYIGTVAGTQMLVGPIPFDITADYKYVKIFDGSTFVAVAGIIEVLPAFSLTPDSGAPCTSVTLSGSALPANVVYNITYGSRLDYQFIAQVTSTNSGKLSYTWDIINFEDTDYIGDIDYIGVHIIENSTGTDLDYVVFFESQSYLGGITIDGDDYTEPWLNNTALPYSFHVFDEIALNGSFMCVSCGHVTITIDGVTVGTATLNSAGNFTADFVIPELQNGAHVVKVNDCSRTYFFNITVYPTLIVTPEEGPVGTVITLTAYGFDPANVYYLYWQGICINELPEDDDYMIWIANATVGANGKFNMSAPVTFTVPNSYGGSHDIDAWYLVNWTEVAAEGYNYTLLPQNVLYYSSEEADEYTETHFTVTPTIWFTPSTIDSDGTTFDLMGSGLDPDVPYAVNIDNQAFATGYDDYYGAHILFSDDCGGLKLTLVAAGFSPGLHVGALYWDAYYWDDGTYGEYAPAAFATFTVTTVGDPVATMLLNMSGSVATIQTTTGTIKTSLDAIGLQVTAINGTVATIKTDLGTLTGTITAMNGDIATIKTQVGTINANVASVKSFLPVDMMPVWIAVIFAIIAAIAAIYGVLVIRSKIAQ
jgi:hypothetical protein